MRPSKPPDMPMGTHVFDTHNCSCRIDDNEVYERVKDLFGDDNSDLITYLCAVVSMVR